MAIDVSSQSGQVTDLKTMEEVKDFVAEGYRAIYPAHARYGRETLRFGFSHGRLPPAIAEPAPLIEHAVRLAGPDGLTFQQLSKVFDQMGAERLGRGLSAARESGRIEKCIESRPNKAGRAQKQAVLRAVV
jgi:hypothetical protein